MEATCCCQPSYNRRESPLSDPKMGGFKLNQTYRKKTCLYRHQAKLNKTCVLLSRMLFCFCFCLPQRSGGSTVIYITRHSVSQTRQNASRGYSFVNVFLIAYCGVWYLPCTHYRSAESSRTDWMEVPVSLRG